MRSIVKRNWNWFIALAALTAVTALVAYAALDRGNVERTDDSEAALLTRAESNGHGAASVVHDGEPGHHDSATTSEAEADGDGVIEVTLNAVEGRHWGFDPAVVEVRVGHRVRLTLVNSGFAEHDVEIAGVPAENVEVSGVAEDHERLGGGHHPEDVVAAHAEPGTSATVLFTPTAVGEYEFACTIPGHKEAGMMGKLIVTN